MFGKIVNSSYDENRLLVEFENKTGIIEVVNETMFHVMVSEEPEDSPTVNKEKNKLVSVVVDKETEYVQISTSEIFARVFDDFKIDFYKSDGTVICKDYRKERLITNNPTQTDIDLMSKEGHQVELKKENHKIQILKELDKEEYIYGLGDRTGFLNKRGYAYELWNTDNPDPHVDSFERLYKSIPFMISLKKDSIYGLYFNNSYRSFWDFGKESEEYLSIAANQGNLDYFIFAGDQMSDIIEQYTHLTGRVPLPQMWTLGYQQSRWGYETEEDVRRVAEQMRRHRIPCDVIHLDIDYMEDYKVFTWNKEKYKDAKKCILDLSDKGFKIVTIIDPGVKVEKGYSVYEEGVKNHYFVTDIENRIYVNQVWPGDSVYPDFGRFDVRDWWGVQIKFLLDKGVRGIWNDMNEPASFNGEIPDDVVFHNEEEKTTHARMHNMYGHYMSEATYEGLKKYDKKRPFVITRACFAGSQKYTTGWTGDNHSIWSHLQMAIPQLCNLGLSGMGFVGADVGGFGSDTTAELLTRWTQVGCFSPLFRNHSTRGSRNQEPWSFDKQTLDICRKYINLRYQLLPFYYDLFREMELTGAPVMRPLIYQYLQDVNVREINDEFMIGGNMLVAPVVEQGLKKRMVYLPKGIWYNYDTKEKIDGEVYFIQDAPIDICPVYVSAGTILPKYPVQQYVGETEIEDLILDIYPGIGEYIHYQDDSESFAYQQGEYNQYQIKLDEKGMLSICMLHNGYVKTYKNFVIHYDEKVISIPFSGEVLNYQL